MSVFAILTFQEYKCCHVPVAIVGSALSTRRQDGVENGDIQVCVGVTVWRGCTIKSSWGLRCLHDVA